MKIVSAAEAVAGIRSGESIYLHGASATPSVLLDALVARAAELQDVRVVHLHCEGPGPHLAPEMAGHFRHTALFIGPNARQAVNEGRADYIPAFLSDVPHLFRRRIVPLDTVLINVSPPDQHGFCSLGTSVDATLAAVETRPPPSSRSSTAPCRGRWATASSTSIASTSRSRWTCRRTSTTGPPIGPLERRIGAHVAELVPDGAVLQMGIGAIPAAVAMDLLGKRDLGVHTEMFTDVMVDLVESGAVTGALKEINRGKIVTAFMMGTQRLYRFVDNNPMVEMRPVDYTNDTAVIRRLRRMTAINSAIEIDLTGQVCADSIGHRLYSGIGGQMDFVRGAALAEDGRSIIALPSTTKDGQVSRIVPFLREGAGVVTTRGHVQTVVTEWGIAELHGRSLGERARALIAIAHPDFRDELTAAARKTLFL